MKFYEVNNKMSSRVPSTHFSRQIDKVDILYIIYVLLRLLNWISVYSSAIMKIENSSQKPTFNFRLFLFYLTIVVLSFHSQSDIVDQMILTNVLQGSRKIEIYNQSHFLCQLNIYYSTNRSFLEIIFVIQQQ